MEKVKLPREVAEAIDKFRELYKAGAEYDLELMKGEKWDYTDKIYDYIQESRENLVRYYKALVNGYEVEQAPEDEVREYYQSLKTGSNKAISNTDKHFLDGKINAVEVVLRKLGIKIEGINA